MAEATADHSQHSDVLHCLASLGGETFAGMLLPKLAKQGSAGAIALTCSQLRDLCHGSVQQLDLTNIFEKDSSDNSAVEESMLSLPQRFSSCTSAQLRLHGEGSYFRLSYLLTGLARLPKLGSLVVTVEGDTLPAAPMALALHSMRTQLLQLRCLYLKLQQSWRGAAMRGMSLAT